MFRPEVVGEAAILCGLDTVFVGDLAPVERCVIASGYITPTDPYFQGQPTNAVYGFTSLHLKMIAELKPDYIVACYDLPHKTFRHDAYEA